MPDGRVEHIDGFLYDITPYNQWFSIIVDASNQSYKIMDFFLDAELIAILEWDTDADLDLIIWDHYYEEAYYPEDFFGIDSVDGQKAIEIFQFGYFDDMYGEYDFTYGLMDIYVGMNDLDMPETHAKVKLIHVDGFVTQFEHIFTPEKSLYLWNVIEYLDPQSLEYEDPAVKRTFLH